jgi:carboxyl-terminal processing protease
LTIYSDLLNSPLGKRIGYIALVGFTDNTTDEQFADILQSLSNTVPLDGLIIDNRENTGGADTVMVPILELFTSGVMGYYVNRNEERPLRIAQVNDVSGSSRIQLAILIGSNTVSYGEIFSGILQDIGRAILIGDQTEGNVETLWGYNFDDGSRAWIAHDTFRPVKHPDQDWEETGIIPDINLIVDWDEYPLTEDPAVIEAIHYFDQTNP